ncbi:uncharacterized protein LY89DRAFT_712404 [Mollisia scopiformis]|uniref:Uncharacterized protein n=1 Tax=Mollisia scopiformis TaxID=149040 RepID=A0A132B3P8_MOLSC|nr:uncharacterized protein LY89DRAFT_712404 [Mollisia scopiformis]KUJ06873.1 hypothetical protein LY89DRAFT_712404 [Mollisia scopiformis]
MAPYYPLFVTRSDGLLEFITKTGVKELNQPTTAQLNDTPDANGNVDCYRSLEPDAEKAIDWRRKLGGMMMRELGGNSDEFSKTRNYILKELPDGYTLWEHVKYNKDKMTEDKKDKGGKHAAGTYERQDAYLYGHPQGRKKRFRSPADFFPHLLWLAVDREDDPANCSCKICSPEGDGEVAENAGKAKSEDKPIKKEQKPTPIFAPTPKAIPITTSVPVVLVPSKLPAQPTRQVTTRSSEQQADGDPNSKFLYRPGEVVWFNNDPNWRLGVIGKRGLVTGQPRYLIQPLSNPLEHQAQQIKDQETSLRPWLAWSVPETTNPSLNNMAFENVPWDRVVAGEFDGNRKHDHVVDGSILAAKMVDASYSLFERQENALASPGEVHYNGMFLGAEKIWVGEPVRLKVPPKPVPDMVVMVIQKLIERTVQGKSSVTFVGDVYKFVEMPSQYTNRSQWPTPDLPARMVADLRFRNETAENAGTNTWYEWRLLEPAAHKELTDIRGRWYETKTLLPILRGAAQFKLDQIAGKLGDAGEWMNSRRDNNKVPEQRKKNRRDTLGPSVPAEFKVSRGLNGPAADNIFPDEQQLRPAPPFEGAADLEQFMDLDGTGQEFYA